MSDQTDDRAEEEARLAARDAGHIGGTPSDGLEAGLPDDPALVPVYEAGGGEAEGFEMAEEELIENASLGPVTPGVEVRAVRAEVDRETEENPDTEVYGEADEVDVSEDEPH